MRPRYTSSGLPPWVRVVLMGSITVVLAACVFYVVSSLGGGEPRTIYEDGTTECLTFGSDAWCERGGEVVCRFYYERRAGIPEGCFDSTRTNEERDA